VTRPTVEVADILRARGNDFIDRHQLRLQQLKVIRVSMPVEISPEFRLKFPHPRF
jgi:hypothetical protein